MLFNDESERGGYTLVVRKPNFGLPTACPICLPVFIYLKLARFAFELDFNSTYPDSDQIPYVESGTYVIYNNENSGVIERLKEDGIVDLDRMFSSVPDWISLKAMISSWLEDAVIYELWVGSNGGSSYKIYYSELPWCIGKALFTKQVTSVKQRFGITKANFNQREEEIYKRARVAYGALSERLELQDFVFENRPSSLDACLVGHVLFTLKALPETSALRGELLQHANLVQYATRLKGEFLEADSSSSSSSQKPPFTYSSNPKRRTPKREVSAEEEALRRKGKYFLMAQLLSVLLFLSFIGGGYELVAGDSNDD